MKVFLVFGKEDRFQEKLMNDIIKYGGVKIPSINKVTDHNTFSRELETIDPENGVIAISCFGSCFGTGELYTLHRIIERAEEKRNIRIKAKVYHLH